MTDRLHLAGIRRLLNADLVPFHELDLVLGLLVVVGSPTHVAPEVDVPVLVEEHGGDPVLLPAAVVPPVVPLEGDDAGPGVLDVFEDHQVEAEAEVWSPGGDLTHQLSLLQCRAWPLVDINPHGLLNDGNSRDFE